MMFNIKIKHIDYFLGTHLIFCAKTVSFPRLLCCLAKAMSSPKRRRLCSIGARCTEIEDAVCAADVITTQVGASIVEFLGQDFYWLLCTAKCFTRSADVAVAASWSENFRLKYFGLSVREDEACIRRMLDVFYRVSVDDYMFGHFWWPVAKKIRDREDIMALACCRCFEVAYNYVPVHMRMNETFIRSLVDQAWDEPETIGPSRIKAKWISANVLQDRDVALQCAQKGISPFVNGPQWLSDIEIVRGYMISACQCTDELYDAVQQHRRSWKIGRLIDFFIGIVHESPYFAVSLIEYLTDSDDARALISVADPTLVPSFRYGEHIWSRVWRDAVRRNVDCLQFVDPDEHCTMSTDRLWIQEILMSDPSLFRKTMFANARWAAKVVLSVAGLEIRQTPWISDRELALLAVNNDGRALKYLYRRLAADPQVALAAVKQHWAALAWVPSSAVTNEILDAAVRQNAAAAELVV